MMKRNFQPSETPEEFAASMELLAAEQLTDKEGLDAAKPILFRDVEDNFDLAATAAGVPWPPHAPLTVKIHGPHPLLILTGKMKAAALGTGAGKIESNDGETLTIGVDGGEIPYAGVHQDGGGRVPQREFFAISDEGCDAVADMFADRAMELAASTVA